MLANSVFVLSNKKKLLVILPGKRRTFPVNQRKNPLSSWRGEGITVY
jgi:hypothetical protein